MHRAIFPAVTMILSGAVFATVWTMTDPAVAGAPPAATAIPVAEAAPAPVAGRNTMRGVARRIASVATRRHKHAFVGQERLAAPLPDTASVAVFYPGCRAVRAAGAAPLYRGQPAYRPEMDGDDDGIACEPYRGG